jgi:hypothetical protein
VRDSDTFWDEVQELGIYKHEKVRRVKGKQKMVADFYYSRYVVHVKALYKSLEITPWPHMDSEVFDSNIASYEKVWSDVDFQN